MSGNFQTEQKSKMSKCINAEFVFAAIIFIAKIVLTGLFSSDYQNKMFEPFISDWFDGLKSGCFNPYQYYYDNGLTVNFPYPPAMLYIMSIGMLFCRIFPGAPLFVHNILFKIPLLLADFAEYIILLKIVKSPGKKTALKFIYYLSPVMLYSTFMHSQLDIIPMVFITLSLYFISGCYKRSYFILSALCAAVSIMTKLHIAAVIPLILIYVYKRFGIGRALHYFSVMGAAVILIIMPFAGTGFTEGVIFTSEAGTLFDLYFPFNNLKLYISLFAIGFIYLYLINLNILNKDLLFGFGGTIFAVFLALCVPMPGWYVWIVPFVSIYVINKNCYMDSIIAYIFLQLSYIIYFLFFHIRAGVCDLYFLNVDCSSLKVSDEAFKNIAFTAMTCSLVFIIFKMFMSGIKSNSIFNFHDKHFVIGICGDSSTGKSCMQKKLCNIIGEKNFCMIEGDGDHKWERLDKNWNDFTHLNPKANFLYRQAEDISNLRNNQPVQRVDYDHSTGKFTQSYTLLPKRFISISGLHTFYLPQLRECIDLKIYMDAQEELRCMWKEQRDSSQRNHSKEEIYAQIQSRKADAEKYIFPQKQYADVIFYHFIDEGDNSHIGLRALVSTRTDIELIVTLLHNAGLSIKYTFSDDCKYQIIEYNPSQNKIDGEINYSYIYDMVIDDMYELFNISEMAKSLDDLIQELIIIKTIINKMKAGAK